MRISKGSRAKKFGLGMCCSSTRISVLIHTYGCEIEFVSASQKTVRPCDGRIVQETHRADVTGRSGDREPSTRGVFRPPACPPRARKPFFYVPVPRSQEDPQDLLSSGGACALPRAPASCKWTGGRPEASALDTLCLKLVESVSL